MEKLSQKKESVLLFVWKSNGVDGQMSPKPICIYIYIDIEYNNNNNNKQL